MQQFQIDVPQSALDDLARRLNAVRLPRDFGNDRWQYGVNTDYLHQVIEHWRTRYDWRATERELNRYEHFRRSIDGVPLHFMRARGVGLNPMPLILTHGWPWTFWDYKKLLAPLSDPAAHGGDPADAFDIIVPSLPGHAFSSPLTKTGINWWKTADLWAELMTALGYDRFAAGGGDWGSLISAQLGHKYSERVIGVHLHLLVPLDMLTGGTFAPDDFAAEEQALPQANSDFTATEMGYFAVQSTKPQTLAVGLEDSPAGMLAWILEKRRRWSDCGGDVEKRFSKDDLIDTTMLYWLTESLSTSFRFYYEAAHNPWNPEDPCLPVVRAPTGAAAFPGEIVRAPRKWAERYYNLKSWTPMRAGGHFAPMEEPAAMVDDIRQFFRELRS